MLLYIIMETLTDTYPMYGMYVDINSNNINYMTNKDLIEQTIQNEQTKGDVTNYNNYVNEQKTYRNEIENIPIQHPQTIGSGMKKGRPIFTVKNKYKSKYS